MISQIGIHLNKLTRHKTVDHVWYLARIRAKVWQLSIDQPIDHAIDKNVDLAIDQGTLTELSWTNYTN